MRIARVCTISALLFAVAACSGASGGAKNALPPGSSGGQDTASDPSSADGGPSSAGDSDGFEECADDTFEATPGLKAGNIVWVIDTSGSMDEEAALVQQNINLFVKSIQSAGLVDYRVVVVSEKSFVTVPAPLGADAVHFLYVEEEVGSNEPLLDLLARFGDFSGFLLKDAVTHFVVVTDDESDIAASAFVTQMKTKLGGEMRVHAIASPPGAPTPPSGDDDDDDDDDSGCVGTYGDAAAPGVQHYEAARLTNGLTFSICSEDWTALFKELADEVGSSAPIPCDLLMPEAAPGSTLDPELVKVVLTPPQTNQAGNLPRVGSANDCGTSMGWYYDNPTKPTRMVLCPSACDTAKQGGRLDIKIGCMTSLQ